MFVVRKCWHVCPVYSNTSDRWYTEKRAGHDKITKTSMAGVTVLKWGGGDCSKWGNFAFVQLKTKLIFYSLNCRIFCCAIWFRDFALEGDQFSHNNMGAMRITSDHLHRSVEAIDRLHLRKCSRWNHGLARGRLLIRTTCDWSGTQVSISKNRNNSKNHNNNIIIRIGAAFLISFYWTSQASLLRISKCPEDFCSHCRLPPFVKGSRPCGEATGGLCQKRAVSVQFHTILCLQWLFWVKWKPSWVLMAKAKSQKVVACGGSGSACTRWE